MINPVSAKNLGKISLFVNSVRTSSSNSNSTRYLIQISHFSNYSPNAASASHSYASRRQEEGIRNVRVSVWWDFENCQVPVGANVFRVAQCITAAIRANGIKGPIQITAFGDVMQISRLNQEALSSTGINLTHIPRGGKNSADRSLLVDLMCWVSQNPPPAHLFLISGDRDFAGILHRLRMNNYNILLASPESAPSVLCSAASIMWHWNSLLKGENLVGKHFNQPPDGPHGSWYGHYKVPLEDPFAVAEDPVCLQAENSPDSGPDKVLKLQRESDGQLLVCDLPPKALEQDEHTPGVTTEHVQNGKEHSALTSRLNEVQTAPQQLPVLLSHEPKLESTPSNSQDNKVHDDPKEVPETPALIQGVERAESTQAHLAKYHPVSEPGFFRRLWRKWFGHDDVSLEEKSGTASTISPEKLKSKEEDLNSTIQQVDSVIKTPFSSSSNETGTNNNKLKTTIADNEKSRKNSSFLSQIMRFWRGSVVSDDINETLKEKPDQIELDSENGMFVKQSFWNEVKAFIDTPEGAAVVRQSTTRAQMAENLGKQGPQSLRSFSEADLLHLVNLVILDKKWIEESPSQAFPFKVIPSEDEPSFSSPSGSVHNSNELGSVMFQKLKELHRHRRIQSSPHAGSPYPIAERNISKNQIVLDCQKLISELLKEYPEGYNLGNFRKMFFEKYGYPLDLHRVGYEKLATFLQTMPGVTVVSTYLFPSQNQRSQNLEAAESFSQESEFGDTEANSESEQSDGSRKKDDDLDSPWEELGPLSNSGPKNRVTQSGPSRKMKGETQKKIQNEYESLSDDDFSDTEEETSSHITSESKKKSPTSEADSSLLQILDSWYKTKDDDNKPSGSEDTCVVAAAAAADSCQSSSFESTIKKETPSRTTGRKHRHSRSYSFVTEDPVDNKDRLIDGILGSLKKTSERC